MTFTWTANITQLIKTSLTCTEILYTTDAQTLLLHASALHECHYQGVFTVFKVEL